MSEKYESDFSESRQETAAIDDAQAGAEAAIESETIANQATANDGVAGGGKRKFRWSRNKFIALGAALMLLGGGGAWAYNAYQSPTTVIGMAIGSLFGQKNPAYDIKVTTSGNGVQGFKGSLNMQVSSGDVGTDLKAKLALDLVGQNIGATLEALSTKSGDAYLSLSKFDSLIALVQGLGTLPSSANLSSIDGKWIKVSKAEVDQLTGSANSSITCLQDKFKDSAHASAVSSEMIDLAKAHEFMVVSKELGTKDGQVGYEMTFDVAQLKAFFTGVLDTKAFADYTECTGVDSSLPSKAEMKRSIETIDAVEIKKATKDIHIAIWADQFSHKLSKLSVVDSQPTSSFALELAPAGDRSAQVKIPAESISVAQLQSVFLASALASSTGQ